MQYATHQYTSVDGLDLFYREAGSADAPVVLLLHGSPSSSIQFRYMLADLSDRWRLIAPDLPAFGFTEFRTNPRYNFTFDNLAMTVGRFIEKLGLRISAVYLHDYGAQVGFRLLTGGIIHPRGLMIQNSDVYHGVGWRDPMCSLDQQFLPGADVLLFCRKAQMRGPDGEALGTDGNLTRLARAEI
jgi:pimeloyl-ACP methyl ester carboxylesterase